MRKQNGGRLLLSPVIAFLKIIIPFVNSLHFCIHISADNIKVSDTWYERYLRPQEG